MSLLPISLIFLLAALVVYLLRRRIFAQVLKLPPARYAVQVEKDLAVPMHDGISLDAVHYAPTGAESFPTILIRSPWKKAPFNLLYVFIGQRFAERGYHVVVQHTREIASGMAHTYEASDGQDALVWLAQQSWFDENLGVGMWGASYLGYVQWAIADHAPPFLKAIVPVTTAARWSSFFFPDDSFALETTLRLRSVLHMVGQPLHRLVLGTKQQEQALQAALKHLPIAEADTIAFGKVDPDYREILDHPDVRDPLWHTVDHSAVATPLTVQPHLIAGWFDLFLPLQLADYAALRSAGHTPYLTIGPWHHTSTDLAWESVRQALSWFEAHLKHDRQAVRSRAVRVYVMGINAWRDFETWPPPAQAIRYYLQQHHLSVEEPAVDSTPDRYRYDPNDPTPTIGGAVINNQPGQQDNRLIEQRGDVVCYTTSPLASALEIIGPVQVELYVRSSVAYTDFFARLCDVTPAGKSLNVCEGLLRLAPGKGEVQPDGTLRILIELWPTAYHFAPGHCLRLQVSSGAQPRWNRHLGTAEPFVNATQGLCADQMIYHDRAHPSALILPGTA